MAVKTKDVQKHFEVKLEAEAGPYGLKKLLEVEKGKITVLDVRSPEDYAQERIPGAIHMTLAELEKRWKELPKKNRIVTYCYSFMCSLAPRAALFLAKKGFRTTELVGGIADWKERGFDVETPSGIKHAREETAAA